MMHQIHEISGSYSFSLVLLSLVIAIVASYTSLDLALRVATSHGWSRKAWLISGAIAMGTGIWSMHFVAMLAFHLSQAVSYDLFIIAVSILISIAASFAGLWFASAPEKEVMKLMIGGCFLGIGISGMHYIGMEAMKGVNISYHPVFYFLSILVAICTSIIAMMLVFYLRDHTSPDRHIRKLTSSLVMGIAIFGMHFTGMKATIFTPPHSKVTTANHVFNIDQADLAIIIAIFTLIMLFLVLTSSYIDQKFKTQREMQRAEKLRVLGDLTCAFAHEIRNPMQVNRGFLQLLNERPLPADVKKYINICIEEMDRANGIISDYLSFAKPEAEHIEPIDVADQIQRVINIVSSYAMMNKVEIRSHLEPSLIWGNTQKFSQSLINILKNGVEAMPRGGKLYVSCKNHNRDVVIDIMDEGVGMSKEQMEKLGTPFYSLKEKGTGLGLMVSYRIIHSFYGKIQVSSEKGKGTTFSIIIPQWASHSNERKQLL